MSIIARGTIHDGPIVLAEPLSLPDGAQVVLSITPAEPSDTVDFARMPSFGMWADRGELGDSHAWLLGLWEPVTAEESEGNPVDD